MAAICSGNLYGCRTSPPTDVSADSGAFPELCLTVCPVVLTRIMEDGTRQSHEIAPINSNLTSSHSATVQGRVGKIERFRKTLTYFFFRYKGGLNLVSSRGSKGRMTR